GTPHILSLAALSGALMPYEAVGISAVEAASAVVTAELCECLVDVASTGGWTVITPQDPKQRGGHIALAHRDAGRIAKALRGYGVIPDHRPPDILRLAPPPWSTDKSAVDEVVARILLATRDVEDGLGDPEDRELVP
ncbi:MAG: kynureninase, partial [Armatimonadota bacterium]